MRIINLLLWVCCSILLLSTSCKKKHTSVPAQNKGIENIGAMYMPLKYAKNFEVNYYKGYKQIRVKNSIAPNTHIDYYVIEDSIYTPKIGANDILIHTHATKKVALISTPYVRFIEMLNESHRIVAVSDIDYIFSPNIKSYYDSGKIVNIGFEEAMNYEKLLQSKAQIIFTYNGKSTIAQKLKQLHIHSVYTSEYLETHPLAQAEWLLFFAAFLNKEKEAQVLFDSIEHEYMQTVAMCKNAKNKPTIMCNLPYKDNWYIPGGKSLAAQLLRDAAASYVYNDTVNTGGVQVAYEKALSLATASDYFFHVNSCRTLNEVKKQFPAIVSMPAYKKKHIYNNNLRMRGEKANDYWESGISNPSWVLKDIAYILHPELFPGYSLRYYKKLE